MGIKIIYGDKITIKYLHECLELDYDNYDEDQHLEYDLIEGFFKKNPNIYIMAIDEIKDKAIGYINFAPVREEIYNKLKKGLIFDSEISVEDILQYEDNKSYNCYFYSIVIKREYQKKGIANLLILKLKKYVEKLECERNITIKKIVADVLSDGGECIANKFNMKYIGNSKHGSKIFEFINSR